MFIKLKLLIQSDPNFFGELTIWSNINILIYVYKDAVIKKKKFFLSMMADNEDIVGLKYYKKIRTM